MKPCICGKDPKFTVELWNPYPKTYRVKCDCGRSTAGKFMELEAIRDWDQDEIELKDFDDCL